ncbi:MAG: RluA family pseudouridine synthase [Candidatus Eremiobacteraeota bacterium]|nr:RluA family pseudouridine synthase [Candidatus Eremiobacteraeota bacterium]
MPTNDANAEFSAAPEDVGSRLDVALARRLDRSRSACAELIKSGSITIDGRLVKPSFIVAVGNRIRVAALPPREASARPQDIPIRIVHDEADFCVVDKPPGMATHPARGTPDGTLVNALLAKLGSLPAINGVRRPGIVHRLDKDTSGLLVVAKSERAMLALSQALAQRHIKRRYDAAVVGVPANARGIIDAPIGRDPEARTKFAVREDGRRAVTHYAVQEAFGNAALLRLELETGRTHQIRVHAAAIGHPIVADATYSPDAPSFGMRRQALHAAELDFDHPINGQPLHFAAPWPADFAELIARLRASSQR